MPDKKPAFLPLIRELARCYQAFEHISIRHVRTMGLTSCQFDIVATLGNTEGMNFRELGEKTLITKGTLTGVVDRLEEKGLVVRAPDNRDGRSQLVRLTNSGETLFAEIFPAHMAFMAGVFSNVPETDVLEMRQALAHLRQIFQPEQE